MINIDNGPEEIVRQLSETEKNIMYVLGKMRISVNKNFDEHTLKKKLSNEDLKNYDEAFSNLFTSGLIVRYRPGNYALPKEGREVADEVVEQKRQKIYGGLRILMLKV